MKKNSNVQVEDNGKAFLVVTDRGTDERLVVAAFLSLGDAWRHIEWMYGIETQEFTVGTKKTPVKEWIKKMHECGALE